MFRPVKLGLSQHQSRFALFPGGDPRANDRYLIVHVFDRPDYLETRTSSLGYRTAGGGLRHHQFGLGRDDSRLFNRHLHTIRLRIEFHQDIPFFHPVVIFDQDPGHLSGDARSDKGYVTIYVGVVSRDSIEGADNFGDAEEQGDHH